MRLVRLELAGFGTFRERTELDFDDVDFFALVGPTGSGKSTVIDAVCFALYGSVPRYDHRNLIRYVVALGAMEAKVSLRFELGGDEYVATRVVRRSAKGAVTTKEARLERGADVLAGNERELSAAVERLLGLKFDDFTRCVALPQGEFAQFLRAKGDERRDLLIRLLHLGVYERVGARARARAAEAATRLGVRRERLAELAGATPEALADAEARHRSVERLQQAVADAVAAVEALDAELRGHEEAREAAERAVGALRGVAVPAEARRLGDEQARLDADLAAARAEVDEREAARVAADEALAALPDPAELQAALAAHADLAEVDAQREDLARARVDGEAALAEADGELAAAEDAARRAADALDAARRAHRAHELAEALAVGHDCPVCLRPVDALPHHPPAPALDAAKRAADAAAADVDAARRRRADVEKRCSAVEGRTGDLDRRRSRLAARVADHPDRRALEALAASVVAAAGAAQAARRAEDEARATARSAERRRDRLAADVRSVEQTFDRQRDRVAALGPPAPRRVKVLDDWEELAAWAAGQVPVHEERRDRAAALAGRAAADRRERFDGLRTGFAGAGLDPPRDDRPAAFVRTVAEAATAARAEVDRVAAAVEEAAALRRSVDDLAAEAEVAELLGALLRSNNFPDWLVAEGLHVLAAEASATLLALTGGRYSLATTDKEFVVVDHANADEARPARTLSGGETFQASLALALALSSQVRNLAAEGAPRLDAIFLDEGFGTLDPETLDVVAATIENLGQSGRMVGVVTHVRELALRVPVRYEVRKGHRTSTVERVLA